MKYPFNLPKFEVSSGFGMRTHPTQKTKKMHNGVDFPMPEGTHILAPADGVVIFANFHKDGGYQLGIEHDNGLVSSFAHLSDNNVVGVGERVTTGQLIALSGNTGASTGAHLHFAIKKDGQFVNPMKYLPKK